MGKNCEFLHEYNLRKFPECWWWGSYGFCTSGEECLYEHPKVRKRECEDFNRGFCILGKLVVVQASWITLMACLAQVRIARGNTSRGFFAPHILQDSALMVRNAS